MPSQGVLGFQYEAETSAGGPTSLAGLPLYLDLIRRTALAAAIRQHVRVAGAQGWLDIQMVLAVIFLNLAGGDGVEDLERLEQDSSFAAVLQALSGSCYRATSVGGCASVGAGRTIGRCRRGGVADRMGDAVSSIGGARRAASDPSADTATRRERRLPGCPGLPHRPWR